jgi:hypothetical protein
MKMSECGRDSRTREIGFVARREGPSLNPSPLRKSYDLVAMCADLKRNSSFHDVAITMILVGPRPNQLFRGEGDSQSGTAPRDIFISPASPSLS